MKKLILSILSIYIFSQCVILNPIGLNSDRIKGTEAASKIRSAAITQDLLLSVAFLGRPIISILSILADDIAGIDGSKYYLESEVNSCISKIRGFEGFLLGAGLTVAASCKLKPADGYITGKPLPKL
ncbi:MAG TPA: TIGR04452 family lipoprotein [Leptospiraceae bacterium]|nr:TIGR04452 family lipoprotein [Leptospiraceae bacterium]HMW03531.1 TIGR04452 family lipoprotein [Leptospiraceae bacterium]HMX33906.1 TIGR04452 family lipoprotein [Leptospiraceae bacterium]HMY29549.1 TIGR04452 family lipoprotein [Leptospiraceae bacterium]HMZ64811.1 TIGR04452 family lipoprotein [Leptospiraceae bacterium]